ncbi:protein pxr1-like [Willisornis vidua]|uniref:Protein pxr1-like n=1 Tax=Willisornis vidua TaxID=1566151 RepID=A0ABQ9CT80_9PASS|nr:protein pxr1-like [Willisornis vidua]
MPAGSRTEPLLAKAGPIMNDSNASVITYQRRKTKINGQMELWPEKSKVRICERNSYGDTMVSGEEVGEGAPGSGAEIPLQPMV